MGTTRERSGLALQPLFRRTHTTPDRQDLCLCGPKPRVEWDERQRHYYLFYQFKRLEVRKEDVSP